MECLLQHFPRDIANMIDTMKSHAEHHDLLKACFLPLQINVLIRQMKRMDIKMYDRSQYDLDTLYRETIPDLRVALELLSQCNCCEAHQKYKPVSPDTLRPSQYRVCCSLKTEESKSKCACPCRHFARRLTRAHIYSQYEHEEDNRAILHQAFQQTHEQFMQEIEKLTTLKKQKKTLLRKLNVVLKAEEYLDQYRKIHCDYYQVLSEIEEQEIVLHKWEDKDIDTTHALENHILDFPEIRNEADALFVDMYLYPGYGMRYIESDIDSDIEMTV